MRKLIIAFIALIVIIVGGLAALPLFLSAETVRNELASRIEAATGRATRIDGPISFSVIPRARLSAEGIGIAGIAGDSEAFSVESVSFGLSLLPLLSGNIEISGVSLTRPSILIESDGSGGTNWSPAEQDATPPPSSIEDIIASPQDDPSTDAIAMLDRLSIGKIAITDGTLIWRDRASGSEERIDSLTLDIRVPKLDDAGTIEGSFTRFGVAQSFELAIGERPDPTRFDSVPVAMTLSADASTLTMAGTALAGDQYFNGTIEAEGDSFHQFARGLGVDLPRLPAFGEFQAASRVAIDASQINVEQYSLDLGTINLRGGAAIGLDRARPGIGLKIEAGRIDTALFVEEAESNAGSDTNAGTSGLAGTGTDDRIDFSALGLFDANIDFTAKELLVGAVPATDLDVDIQILDGGLRADINNVVVNGRPGRGSIVIDNSGATPSISGDIAVDGLDVGGLVALAGIESPVDAGEVGLDIVFSTQGDTQTALTDNLNGSGQVALANGRVSDAGRQMASGIGFETVSFNGNVTLTKDHFAFEEAAFSLDNSSGIGSGKFTFAGVPDLTAGLAMKRLDLTPYVAASGAGGGGGGATGSAQADSNPGSGGGWSNDRIAFDGLRTINANINLRTEEIIADQIAIGPSNLTVKIAGGGLVAELTEMALYSGIGVGTLSIDGSAATPALAAFFRLDGIQSLEFLRDTADFSRIEGTAALFFDIRSSGNSEAELMAALNGKGAVEFRDGAIRGINIPKMVRSLSIDTLLGWQQSDNEKTDFSQLSGTYTISNGTLTNSDLVMVGPLLRVTGAGTVDIPNRTLAYRVDPKVVATLEGQGGSQELDGFAVPIRIDGAWDRPRIYPEIEGILQDPQKALDQLRALGGGLFGGKSSDGQQSGDGGGKSIEDTLKDEAAKGLDQLFGGFGGTNETEPTQPPPVADPGPTQLPPDQPIDLIPPAEPPPVAEAGQSPEADEQQPLDLSPPLDGNVGETPEEPSTNDGPPLDDTSQDTPETPFGDPADLLNNLFNQ